MKGKVAVLGDADFVKPFSALGLDTYPVGEGVGEIGEKSAEIIEGKYALIVVAENIARMVEEAFSDQMNIPTPCLVAVPFTTESDGFATRALGEVLKMATGVNVFQEKDSSQE